MFSHLYPKTDLTFLDGVQLQQHQAQATWKSLQTDLTRALNHAQDLESSGSADAQAQAASMFSAHSNMAIYTLMKVDPDSITQAQRDWLQEFVNDVYEIDAKGRELTEWEPGGDSCFSWRMDNLTKHFSLKFPGDNPPAEEPEEPEEPEIPQEPEMEEPEEQTEASSEEAASGETASALKSSIENLMASLQKLQSEDGNIDFDALGEAKGATVQSMLGVITKVVHGIEEMKQAEDSHEFLSISDDVIDLSESLDEISADDTL